MKFKSYLENLNVNNNFSDDIIIDHANNKKRIENKLKKIAGNKNSISAMDNYEYKNEGDQIFLTQFNQLNEKYPINKNREFQSISQTIETRQSVNKLQKQKKKINIISDLNKYYFERQNQELEILNSYRGDEFQLKERKNSISDLQKEFKIYKNRSKNHHLQPLNSDRQHDKEMKKLEKLMEIKFDNQTIDNSLGKKSFNIFQFIQPKIRHQYRQERDDQREKEYQKLMDFHSVSQKQIHEQSLDYHKNFINKQRHPSVQQLISQQISFEIEQPSLKTKNSSIPQFRKLKQGNNSHHTIEHNLTLNLKDLQIQEPNKVNLDIQQSQFQNIKEQSNKNSVHNLDDINQKTSNRHEQIQNQGMFMFNNQKFEKNFNFLSFINKSNIDTDSYLFDSQIYYNKNSQNYQSMQRKFKRPKKIYKEYVNQVEKNQEKSPYGKFDKQIFQNNEQPQLIKYPHNKLILKPLELHLDIIKPNNKS